MAWSFNPFTGNLDQTGSGAVVFEGEEETFDDLPVGIGDPPVGSSYLVRTSTGVWLVNRRQAGIWIRRNNTGVRATDWEYGGDYPVNSVNGQTGNVVLSSSNVGAIPTLTVTNITVSGNATTNLTAARNALVRVTSSGALANTFILPVSDNQEGDLLTIFAVSITGQSIPIRNSTYTLIVTLSQSSRSRSFLYTGGAWTETTVNAHTHPATDITGTFSTLAANNGSIVASAPVLDLSQTWNNGGVTFTGLRLNVTNTASQSTSYYQEWQEGGVTQAAIRVGGFLYLRSGRLASPVGPGWAESAAFLYNAQSRINSTSILIGSGGTGAGAAGVTLSTENGAEHVLSLRNATNAQTFRLYNTFTDASNYERAKIAWESNVLRIGTEKLGTGSARALEFQTDGITRFTLAAANTATFAGGLALQWGGGGTRIIGATFPSNLLQLQTASTDRLVINDTLVAFGSATNAFPALKRSSTTLQVRLADDSADAPLSASLFSVGSGAFDGVIVRPNAGVIGFARADGATTYIAAFGFDGTTRALVANSGAFIGWSNANATSVTSGDTRLWRDAAGVIAQYNGVNAQAYRLYNTWSSTTSFERLNIRWATNECIIDAEAGSGGGTLRGIKIGSATSSLLGFYGATPVDRPNDVVMSWADDGTMGDVSDAQDLEAREALFKIRDRLRELGLMATT